MPGIIALIGLLVSLSAALMFHNFQEQKYMAEQRESAQGKITAIRQQLNSNLQTLTSLKAFYDSSNFVSRDEFKQFTTPLLQSNPDIQALEWVPKVLRHERESYRQQAIEDGFKNYDIIEPDYSDPNNITFTPAPQRDIYYPVFYVEPYEGNEKILGLDSPNNQSRVAAIARAIKTGKPSASKPFRLAQEIGDQYGVLIFKPIYHKSQSDNEDILGLALLVLRLSDTVMHALKKEPNQESSLNLVIDDITNASSPLTIYSSSTENLKKAPYITSQTFNISGRQWQIQVFAPQSKASFYEDNVIPIAIFTGGLLFTFFITYTFIQLIRRRQVIEAIIEKRTQEIQETKKFQDLIMSSIPDLLFVKDEEFRLIDANPAFLNLYPEGVRDDVIGEISHKGYDPEEAEEFLKHDKIALSEGMSETEETIQFPDGKNPHPLHQKSAL